MSVFKKYISNNEAEAAASAPQSAPQSTPAPAPTSSAPKQQQQPAAPRKQAQPPAGATASQPAPSSKVAATNGRNVLSSDVEIKGKVKFANDLVVDGVIEGEIISDGSLTVGENARIKAEINTRSVVIYGKIHGNINVSDRVDIRANAEMIGDIKAATISIEAGAIFLGKSTVGVPSKLSASEKKSEASSKPADKKTDSKKTANNSGSNKPAQA